MSDEREGAMLTKTQRAFLKGEKEYTGENARQQRYQRRQAIKKRVQNTMLDFKLLLETWGERGSGELFGEKPASGELGKGISALLALLYMETYQHGRFENLLYRGVRKGEERVHPEDEDLVTIDFDIKRVSRVEMQDALNRYRKRGELSDMSQTELAAIAETLRRADHVEGGGIEAARAALNAWERREKQINQALEDDEE